MKENTRNSQLGTPSSTDYSRFESGRPAPPTARPMAEPPRPDPDIASRVLSGIYELACSSGRGEPMPRAVADLLEQRGVQPADARAENWKRVRQLQTVSAGATPLGEALGALDRLVASLGIDDASEALVGLRVELRMQAGPATAAGPAAAAHNSRDPAPRRPGRAGAPARDARQLEGGQARPRPPLLPPALQGGEVVREAPHRRARERVQGRGAASSAAEGVQRGAPRATRRGRGPPSRVPRR